MSDELDALDIRLLELLRDHPRVGVLELSRLSGVARATVTARLQRMESSGVVTGHGPDIDTVAAGYPVQALATLEIAQGELGDVTALLESLPGVLWAYATTGAGDVVCQLAAESNEELQQLLLDVTASGVIRRSTSVVILSVLVPPRALPLLKRRDRPWPARTPPPAR